MRCSQLCSCHLLGAYIPAFTPEEAAELLKAGGKGDAAWPKGLGEPPNAELPANVDPPPKANPDPKEPLEAPPPPRAANPPPPLNAALEAFWDSAANPPPPPPAVLANAAPKAGAVLVGVLASGA